MMLVDSSVWIDHFRDRETEQVAKLRSARPARTILVGDLVMIEVLQGARDDAHAARLESELQAFSFVPLISQTLVVEAASNYRQLRAMGITVRRTIDMIIGTYCIANGCSVLHSDRDFEPMARHLGLQIA